MTGKKPWRQGKTSLIAIIVFLAAVILAECHSAPPKISIEGAKAIMSPIYGEAMVVMTIKNEGGPDLLKGVSTDIPGVVVSFHVMEGGRMAPAATVDIPGGSSTVFKMGSSHIMIQLMPKTMVAGSPFTLTLVFQKSGERKLQLKLEKPAAMEMNHTTD